LTIPTTIDVTTDRAAIFRIRLSVAWLIIPAMIFVIIFFVVPLIVMIERSVFDPSPENYARFFESAVYPRAMFFTLWMSALVTFLCLALGFPYAYLTYLSTGKWQWLLIVLVLLPFWSSLLVRTYAWTILLRDSGLINWALLGVGVIDRPIKLMGNTLGIVIGMTHVLLPFVVLPLIASMRRFDEDLYLAASGLGAPPLIAFWRVFVPHCMPGILAGCLLVFVLAVGFYVTPAILGGRTAFFSLLIVMQVNKLLDFGFGSALGVILLLVVIAAVALGSRVVRLEAMFDQGKR